MSIPDKETSADSFDATHVQERSGANDDDLFNTYYAVPVKRPGTSADSDIERCLYFNNGWLAVDATSLKAAPDQDLVRIQQVDPEGIPRRVQGYIETEGYEINKVVGFYSATARTLDMERDPVCTQFLSQEHGWMDGHGVLRKAWSVVIPVVSTTRRGVILIFRFPATGKTTKLIATADPEVENGSSN